MTIFQSKYAPHSFDDLVFADSNSRKRLLEYANNQRHQSLIFHGPYGTAKTTTAKLIVKERTKGTGVLDVELLRAIDVQKSKALDRIHNTWSLQKVSGVVVPVTIIDEIDHVPDDIQYRLRWDLDQHAEQGGFIFTTNNIHAIEKGIVDRCDVVEFPAANTEQWLDRARDILRQEGIEMSDQKLRELLSTCNGSIRDLMRALEDVVLRFPRAA